MTNEQRTRFAFGDDLASMSIEEAQERITEIKRDKDEAEATLEALLERQGKHLHQSYLGERTAFQRVTGSVLDFFGFGPAYQFTRHTKALERSVGNLHSVVQNAQGLCEEYANQLIESQQLSLKDKELLALNIIVYEGKKVVLSEKMTERDSLRSKTVLGTSGSTEAMALERKVLGLQNDLAMLDVENDQLAVSLMVAEVNRDQTQRLYDNMRDVCARMSIQHATVNGYLQLAVGQTKLLKGTRGAQSARRLHEETGITVARFRKFQKDVPDIAGVVFDKAYDAPRVSLASARANGQSYWRTVAPRIFGDAYQGSTNGNGSP